MANSTTSFVPSGDNTRLLRDAFGQFTTGVTIVTASSDEGSIAIAANSFTSVSMDPPIVLWSANTTSRRFKYFGSAEFFSIHVLASNQDALCWETAKDMGALRSHNLDENDEGVPIIDGCLARFECQRFALHPAGDHHLVLGRVLRAELNRDLEALTFFKGRMSPQTSGAS
ncbi:MAG: flavin reductase family protein [Paracoccaceae bacterium]|nr:flavin reductase family protein [Paracoccaceae bacterium]MDG2257026.1 flavin reductase family protein [Paracoccaceae bacterium]